MKIVQPRDADHSAYVGRGIVGQAFRSRLVKYFNSKPTVPNSVNSTLTFPPTEDPDDILWVDEVICEPLRSGPIELLAIPLSAPADVAGRIAELQMSNTPVAGVLVIARYGGPHEKVNDDFICFDLEGDEGHRDFESFARPLVGIVEHVLGIAIGEETSP